MTDKAQPKITHHGAPLRSVSGELTLQLVELGRLVNRVAELERQAEDYKAEMIREQNNATHFRDRCAELEARLANYNHRRNHRSAPRA